MSTTTDSRIHAAWQALEKHHAEIAPLHLRQLFAEDAERAKRFSVEGAGLFLDYSKNRITAETISLLLKLAKASAEWLRAAMPCSAARRSTTPRSGPCCIGAACAARHARRSRRQGCRPRGP